MNIEKKVDRTESVRETDGVRVRVDKGSIDAVVGARVDFREKGKKGDGFEIENPNETAHECGCGRAN